MPWSSIIDPRPTLKLFSRPLSSKSTALLYRSTQEEVEIHVPNLYTSLGEHDPCVYLRIAHDPSSQSGGFLLTPDDEFITLPKADLSLLASYVTSYKKFWEANKDVKDTNHLRRRWADTIWSLVNDHVDPKTGEKPYSVVRGSFSHIGEPVNLETLEGQTPSWNRLYVWHQITRTSATSGPPEPGMIPIKPAEDQNDTEKSFMWWVKLEGFSGTH